MGVRRVIQTTVGEGASWEQSGHKSYRLNWIVEFDSMANNVADAVAAVGVFPRSACPYNPKAYCRSINPDNIAETVFKVSAEYSTQVDPNDNPLSQRPQTFYESFTFEEQAVKDVTTNKPMQNTAGDPWENPIMRNRSKDSIRFVRNELNYPFALAGSLKWKRNNAAWNGLATGTVLCTNITAAPQDCFYQDQKLYFYQVAYEFLYDPDHKHKSRVPNMGFRKKVTVSGVEKQEWIRDNKKQPVATPVLINEQGTDQLPIGSQPYIVENDIYELADFSLFNITLT